MYSRRTGILQTSNEGLRKIENFNKNLREQYNAKNSPSLTVNTPQRQVPAKGNDFLSSIGTLLGNEEVILIGLILLLLFDINRDYLLIGILAILLLLN